MLALAWTMVIKILIQFTTSDIIVYYYLYTSSKSLIMNNSRFPAKRLRKVVKPIRGFDQIIFRLRLIYFTIRYKL